MKTAIITVAVNDDFKRLLIYSRPFFEAYANKIGADFIHISDKKINLKYGNLEKFQIYELLQTYNRIIFFDCDLIVLEDTPNLFDIVPIDSIGAIYDNPNNDKSYSFRQKEIQYITNCFGENNWKNQYINSGVLVLSSIHKKIFLNPEDRFQFESSYKDQTLLNYNIFKNNFKIFKLEEKYNFIPLFWKKERTVIGGYYDEEMKIMPNIIHFAGVINKPDIINKNIRWLIENNFIKDEHILDSIKKTTPSLFTILLPKILDFSKGNTSNERPIRYIKKIIKNKQLETNKQYKLFYDISELGWSMYLSAHLNYLTKNGEYVAISCPKSREVLYRHKCSKILPLPLDYILEYGHLPSDGNHLFDPLTNKRLKSHAKFSAIFKKTYPEYDVITKYSKFENERLFEPCHHELETKNLCKHLFKDLPVIMVFPRYRTSKFQARNISKEYWIDIISLLIKTFPNMIIASIGAPNGAYNINEIDHPNYFNGVKYETDLMLEIMVALCNTKQGIISIGNQSGTLKIALQCGCPTFMFGNEKKRHVIDENWAKTDIQFYELQISDTGFIVPDLNDMKNEIISFAKKQIKNI